MQINVSNESKKPEITFPCLMQNPRNGSIFLIVGEQNKNGVEAYIGTCLYSKCGGDKVGEYSDNWVNILVPYTGKIELFN